MAFKMRSGNGPLAFKNMGSSPFTYERNPEDFLKRKQKEKEDFITNATVSGVETEKNTNSPRQQKLLDKQSKKDEKQYMKYLKKNKMEGDENTFDNWKKSDDNKTSKREAKRIANAKMSDEDFAVKKAKGKQDFKDAATRVAIGLDPKSSAMDVANFDKSVLGRGSEEIQADWKQAETTRINLANTKASISAQEAIDNEENELPEDDPNAKMTSADKAHEFYNKPLRI